MPLMGGESLQMGENCRPGAVCFSTVALPTFKFLLQVMFFWYIPLSKWGNIILASGSEVTFQFLMLKT